MLLAKLFLFTNPLRSCFVFLNLPELVQAFDERHLFLNEIALQCGHFWFELALAAAKGLKESIYSDEYVYLFGLIKGMDQLKLCHAECPTVIRRLVRWVD